MTTIACNGTIITETIELLRRRGRAETERVALWLAAATPRQPAPVIEVYEPDQITEFDRFRLPPDSIRALMQHLGATRRRIVAQIHTHPREAFHSEADAAWAIIRRVGALSLVLPDFAATTTPANFLHQAKVYEYSAEAEWLLCPNHGPDSRLRIVT